MRRAYREKVNAGLCAYSGCDQPSEAGRRMCRHHRNKMSAYSKSAMRRRVAEGLCRMQGCLNDQVPGKTYCQTHLGVLRRWDKRLREQGLCRGCRRPAITGHRHCRECTLKEIARKQVTTVDVLKSIWTGVCPYSGRQIEIGVNAHLDHKVARANGGGNEVANLQWVHAEVNVAKHKLTEDQFRQLIIDCHQHLV